MLDLNYLFQSFSQPHQYYCPKYCFFFVFRACAQAKIWTSLANLFTSFLQFWPSFPYAFPFYTQFCFAWICGWLTFQKRDKFNLQRLVSKQRNWQSIFPQYITWFFVYNVFRIGTNFQNEVSVERSAFADVSAYQLKSPGNFSGPKSKIQIEIYSPFCFVTDSLTMLSAKLLKPLSWMQTTIALWAPHVNSPRSIC